MTDEIDRVQELTQLEEQCLINQVRAKANIPVGEAGICRDCGRESPRLVVGRCAPCREPTGNRVYSR